MLAYIYIALASDHKYFVNSVYILENYNVWFYPTSIIYSITVSDNSTIKVKWKILECANFMLYLHVLELNNSCQYNKVVAVLVQLVETQA